MKNPLLQTQPDYTVGTKNKGTLYGSGVEGFITSPITKGHADFLLSLVEIEEVCASQALHRVLSTFLRESHAKDDLLFYEKVKKLCVQNSRHVLSHLCKIKQEKLKAAPGFSRQKVSHGNKEPDTPVVQPAAVFYSFSFQLSTNLCPNVSAYATWPTQPANKGTAF